MKFTVKIILLIIIIFNIENSFSQIKKYGKVTLPEFNNDKEYEDAEAVVLFKDRKTELMFKNNVGWTLITTVHERIKINSKEGYDYATKKIKYYIGNNKNDELINVKAATYNLNGKEIIKTKLNKKNIYKNVINERWAEKVFTMPNLKENTIIEWKYTIRSNYFYIINDVVFQYDIPIKYFKAKINIIDHIQFKYWFTNRLNAVIKTKNGLDVEIKNVPALKTEPYVKNIDLYRAKIVFEVFASNFPNDKHRDYSKTWDDVVKTIYKEDSFGKQLKKSNYYKDFIPKILKDSETRKDSILAIFQFVKNKIKWNKVNGKFTKKGVKTAFEDGTGNIAEINLMLTSMLRKIGFKANPIILSTRNYIEPYFPTVEGFNYVICGIEMDNDIFLLDATEAYSYIDVLPLKAINGLGRMIRDDKSSAFINLQPKKTRVIKKNLNIKIDETGNVTGNFRILKTGLEGLQSRKKLNLLDEESLISHFEESYKHIEIEKIKLSNQNKLEKAFVVSAKFKGTDVEESKKSKILVPPLFFLRKAETKLKSNTRKYPMDFGTPFKEIIHVSITLPEGYKVEHKPENAMYSLENKQGMFSYTITEMNNKIIIKAITFLSNPVIKIEDYQDFKKMVLKIIQKESEHIVLIKS